VRRKVCVFELLAVLDAEGFRDVFWEVWLAGCKAQGNRYRKSKQGNKNYLRDELALSRNLEEISTY
jgi:hypothetical protein